MTLNEDRKQTKYGHKRWEHMTHTRQRTDITPPSRALTVPSGGGRSGGPSGQIRTRTDRQGPWWSWELWRPWRCRELRRPWRSWELWRPWRSWELWRPWRSWELWRPWQMVFGGLGLGPLGPAPTAGTLIPLPPPPKFPWEVRGYQEPSGAKHTTWQYKTRQERPPGPDNRTAHRNRSPPGLARKLRLPLGMTSQGPIQGPSASLLPPPRQGGRQLEWPPWPQQEEPPAPDESPWTRQDKIVKMFLWARQNRHTALLAVTCGLDPRG